ncbi:MAG: helix-hairpin-helix domain-containing protein [Candidatus Ancillula sp.]|jgi:competence protein ComEA|nr:helix-hairpin-helix domain-containing protein [Candidatus Ancillula sp.]
MKNLIQETILANFDNRNNSKFENSKKIRLEIDITTFKVILLTFFVLIITSLIYFFHPWTYFLNNTSETLTNPILKKSNSLQDPTTLESSSASKDAYPEQNHLETSQQVIQQAPTDSKININTASASDLQEIKGIGPATAEKIISYRNTHGQFSSLNQLTNIKGIGSATLKKISPYIKIN